MNWNNTYMISYWEDGVKTRMFVVGDEAAESVDFFLREVCPEAEIVSVWNITEIPKELYERKS